MSTYNDQVPESTIKNSQDSVINVLPQAPQSYRPDDPVPAKFHADRESQKLTESTAFQEGHPPPPHHVSNAAIPPIPHEWGVNNISQNPSTNWPQPHPDQEHPHPQPHIHQHHIGVHDIVHAVHDYWAPTPVYPNRPMSRISQLAMIIAANTHKIDQILAKDSMEEFGKGNDELPKQIHEERTKILEAMEELEGLLRGRDGTD